MALPYVRGEIALTTNPLVRPADAAWTRFDSEDVGIRRISCHRGQDIRLSEQEAGEATVVLDNRQRVLDPTNTASPWSPNVKLRRRVRFYASTPPPEALVWDGEALEWDGEALVWSDATERLLFTGYIDRLPNRWVTGDGWAELHAVDLTALLAGEFLPPSVLHVVTLAAGPVHYWPMTESSGVIAEDVAGLNDGSYRHDVTEHARLVPFDERACAVMRRPNGQDTIGQAMNAQLSLGTEFTVAAWWQWLGDTQTASTEPTVFFLSEHTDPRASQNPPAVDMRILLAVQRESIISPDGDALKIWVEDDAGTSKFIDTEGVSLLDKLPHHIALSMATDGEFHIYLDGVELAIDSYVDSSLSGLDLATTFAAMRSLTFGWGITLTSGTDKNDSVLGHGAYWDRLLTDQEIADLHAAGTNPWAGDLTGARLNRILDLIGVDAGDRDIATGIEKCAPTLLDGANAMEYIRKIVATEGGSGFVSADGKFTFTAQTPNDPTPVGVISDDPVGDSGVPYREGGMYPDFSMAYVVNRATIERESGVKQTVQNDDSIDEYGVSGAKTIQTLHQTPSGARGRAAQLVFRNHEPTEILESVDLAPMRDDTPDTFTLDTELGDAVTTIVRPTGGGDPFEQLSLVQRIEHTIDPGNWNMTLGLVRHLVLLEFEWDGSAGDDTGWDESVWPAT